jgi:hypothetical protein
VRCKNAKAEDFGGKDFGKVCFSLCAFAPPTQCARTNPCRFEETL